ncbi:hypothetical protein [Zoogloea sp.]|uniref:hypothetical protein n=1 Tax=Zoogloea sp. TaxID=49181 RepID=UPI001AD39155|nr:hypothetical protein [Zoogloea sp.]MBN8283484.1 hypothetical protein [Zoogloea sp.]
MNTPRNPEFEISLEDEEAESSRNHDDEPTSIDGDDLPVLTDVVDERIEPYIGTSEPIILEPMRTEAELAHTAPPAGITQPPGDLAERLVTLDTAISRLIDDWVANELPQLVSRELDDLAERLRVKASAHLRATLQPLISAEIANTLDDNEG